MSQLAQFQTEAIHRIAAEFGVATVRVFGSMALGTADKNSDLDLLIRLKSTATLIQVIGMPCQLYVKPALVKLRSIPR